ncbi:MAG: hypothetical protein NXH97_06060 [Rhodobacteraceae bacterium]|nr:hypothetical protein [Paracoccaceae bacterium]
MVRYLDGATGHDGRCQPVCTITASKSAAASTQLCVPLVVETVHPPDIDWTDPAGLSIAGGHANFFHKADQRLALGCRVDGFVPSGMVAKNMSGAGCESETGIPAAGSAMAVRSSSPSTPRHWLALFASE